MKSPKTIFKVEYKLSILIIIMIVYKTYNFNFHMCYAMNYDCKYNFNHNIVVNKLSIIIRLILQWITTPESLLYADTSIDFTNNSVLHAAKCLLSPNCTKRHRCTIQYFSYEILSY